MPQDNNLALEARLADLDAKAEVLKGSYAQAMVHLLGLPKNASAKRKQEAFANWHTAAVTFFNHHERVVSVAELLRASHDDAWFTDRVETAENVLETIRSHFLAAREKADNYESAAPVPSPTAFAGLQRLIALTDKDRAKPIREAWLAAGLPVHGFHTPQHRSPKAAELIRSNPWVSGSFYLTVAVVALVLLGVLANTVPLWALPAIIVAGVLLVCVVGGLQLRNDGRLSESNFLKLMGLTFRGLPLVRSLWRTKDTD